MQLLTKVVDCSDSVHRLSRQRALTDFILYQFYKITINIINIHRCLLFDTASKMRNDFSCEKYGRVMSRLVR